MRTSHSGADCNRVTSEPNQFVNDVHYNGDYDDCHYGVVDKVNVDKHELMVVMIIIIMVLMLMVIMVIVIMVWLIRLMLISTS